MDETSRPNDVAVIGGGIVGLATALALLHREAGRVLVLEAEDRIAAHQSSHNSGVIHSGLYYRPGSLKAKTCVAGREEMYEFCEAEGVAVERSGKLVVATRDSEILALEELERRGRANGLDGLRRMVREEMGEIEPEVDGLAALWVPQAGLVDFAEVARAMARRIEDLGGVIRTGFRVSRVEEKAGELVIGAREAEVRTRALVNCAGLQSDRIAHLCGAEPGVAIVPFRGEYYELLPERRFLVRTAIYPVPDPDLPFLGVHFTRTVHGSVEAGPNAVLATRREGYRRSDVSPRDVAAMLGFRGFWRMAATHWRTGLDELHRSLRKSRFVRDLQRLVPAVRAEDLVPGKTGVRAQAVAPNGKLLDDFHVVPGPRSLHLLNAPSPAATSSLSIGRYLAGRICEML
ncbi:MAG: L-2-hydroxyglutarate oxidase [Gemmatimonas sp.]|nr:L-2-hydroxyglutarate oxidase [Gemmatimonas sp.]